MHRLTVDYSLELDSCFHSRGDRLSIDVDSPLMIIDGDLCIPGSHMKGIVRHAAEKVLRTMDKGLACGFVDPARICGKCCVCRLFGSPMSRGVLLFQDVRVDGEKVLMAGKFGVGINRRSRTAHERHLFSKEVSFPQEDLGGRITGVFSDIEELKGAAVLLYMALNMLKHIGGDKSRGQGWLKTINVRMHTEEGELAVVKDMLKGLREMAS